MTTSPDGIKNCIGFVSDTDATIAAQLAERFGLVINNDILPRLSVIDGQLRLVSDVFLPMHIDFCTASLQKRRAAGKQQALIQACKPKQGLRILDVTAGWGTDASILANFGAEVVMIERNPIMAALLSEALLTKPTQWLLSLLFVDARSYLKNLTIVDYPDVIYIDPMHPERKKSALVKKNMQILQQLLGCTSVDEDSSIASMQQDASLVELPKRSIDAIELIDLSICCVRQRVVVKWPQNQPPLRQPDRSIQGKTVRFDIYLP